MGDGTAGGGGREGGEGGGGEGGGGGEVNRVEGGDGAPPGRRTARPGSASHF
jgi:hypothetical protein